MVTFYNQIFIPPHPLPIPSTQQGPWHLWALGYLVPFQSLPSLPLPSDPWDPGLTAKDLLFRGGYQFRRHPRAVLDVTEQVRGPARWTVPWARGYAS